MSVPSTVVGRRIHDVTIIDSLADNPVRGRYRGIGAEGAFLVTTSSGYRIAETELRALLDYGLEGVAGFHWMGEFHDAHGEPYVAMLEAEPAGTPLSDLSRPMAVTDCAVIGALAADVLARAHDQGRALGGVRPELIYVAGTGNDRSVALAPRAPEFLNRATRIDHGAWPPYPRYFSAGETELQPSSPAHDVYALAATLYFAHAGEHIYGPGGYASDAVKLLQREPPVRQLGGQFGALLHAVLTRAPTAPQSAAALATALTGLS